MLLHMATLKDLRERAGLTQVRLAAKLGTGPAQVSDWERGQTVPSWRFIRPLADALGVSLEELFDGVEESGQEGTDARSDA